MRRTISPMPRRGTTKPGSNVNHFGGSVGGPILHNKLFFFFDTEWVRISLPIVTPATVPTPAFESYVLQQLPLGGTDSVTGSVYPAAPCPGAACQVPFYTEDVQAIRKHERDAPGRAGLSLQCGRQPGSRQPARRQRLRQSPKRLAFQRRSRTGADRSHRLQHECKEHRLAALSGRYRLASSLDGSDQPDLRCAVPAAALLRRGGLHTRLFTEPGELFQPRIFVVFELVRAERFAEDTRGISHRARRKRRECAFHYHRRAGQHLAARKARLAGLSE